MNRILIVNVSLAGEDSGTGHTLANIFSDYSADCLMQLSLQIEPEKYKSTIKNTIFLNQNAIPIDTYFRKLVLNFKRNKGNGSPPVTNPNIPQDSVKGSLHDFLRGLLDMSLIKLNTDTINKIKMFKPDVIYTCGSTIRVHKVANQLSELFEIPIILHLMDDWPETIYKSSFLSYFARKKIQKELLYTNKLSNINFAISEALAKKYEKKFSKKYLTLMNPAKHIVKSPNTQIKEIINFVYAGSLTLNRWNSLLQFSSVLSEINESSKCANLQIFIPDSSNNKEIKKMFQQYGVEVNNYVPYEEIVQVYENADVLVHIESFDEEYENFTRYSLSTKIPEYMGMGKPIIAYLPASLHGGQYIKDNNVGLVANDLENLKVALIELINKSHVRELLSNNGIKCAKEKHSLQSVQCKLAIALEKI